MHKRRPQQGLVCYNCNRIGHIAKNCRGRNEKSTGLKNKIDLGEEKGKVKKVNECVKINTEDGSTPIMGVDSSFKNEEDIIV